jgi:Inward rectifier potassium channel transmembrane domain/Inward rectifier potassium channel C-terminal domain
MAEESKPILRSLLDVESYLATSASEKSATIISDGSNYDQRATVLSYFHKQFKKSWIRRLCVKGNILPKHHDRIVDRNGDFHQSNGKMAIKKKIRGEDWRALYAGDLFHSLIDAPSSRSIGILLSGYLFLVVLFSVPYYYISKEYGCDMGIDTYQESFAFSLETMATIGYGTQDIFFDNCWSPVVVLACQISCKLIADAVIIGVIYSRFGRPNTRASTILFSNHAVIRRISGKLYFMFQLVELRKHQLIEAQVRLYVIRRDIDPPVERDSDDKFSVDDISNSKPCQPHDQSDSALPLLKEPVITNFQTCKMRLNYPDDELGGMLIMCLPQVVVHELDSGSPLMPPPLWRSCKCPENSFRWEPRVLNEDSDHENGQQDNSISSRKQTSKKRCSRSHTHNTLKFPNVAQRSRPSKLVKEEVDPFKSDLKNGEVKENVTVVLNRKSSQRLPSPIESFEISNDDCMEQTESYPSIHGHLNKPLLSQTKETSSSSGGVTRLTPRESTIMNFERGGPEEEKDMIALFMADRKMEIMAIVEGIDATTGGVVQARHSFVCSEIEWDKSFAPCVFEDKGDGSAVIDFSVFHNLVDVSEDAAHSGPIPSHT